MPYFKNISITLLLSLLPDYLVIFYFWLYAMPSDILILYWINIEPLRIIEARVIGVMHIFKLL